MKLIVLPFLFASGILCAQDATTASMVADCQATGTYFSSARMGLYNRYISFETYYGPRIFDMQSGRFVAIYKLGDDGEETLGQYLRKTSESSPRYSWKGTKVDDKSSQRRYQIFDSTGRGLQQFTCNYDAFRADLTTGNVLLQEKDKVYLLATDGKQKLLFKTKDDYWIKREGSFLNNGTFYTSGQGDVVNLATGAYTPPIDKLAEAVTVSDDGTTLSAAVRKLGVVRYSLSAKAILDTLLLPALLRDRPYAILPIAGSTRFVAYSTGTAQKFGDGKAYVVEGETALPVCFDKWFEERLAFVESAQAYEAMLAKIKGELESERKRYQPDAETPGTQKTSSPEMCGYCKGSGSIRYEKLVGGLNGSAKDYYTIDQYGTRRYVTTNYGYETIKCTACKGTGKL